MYPGLASIIGPYTHDKKKKESEIDRLDRLKRLEEKIDNNIRKWKELKESHDRRS